MASNPCTPVSIRRHHHQQPQPQQLDQSNAMHEPSRIPLPSPQLLRRSYSMRLRGSTNVGSTDTSATTTKVDGGTSVGEYFHTSSNAANSPTNSPQQSLQQSPLPPSSSSSSSSSSASLHLTSPTSSSRKQRNTLASTKGILRNSKSCQLSNLTSSCGMTTTHQSGKSGGGGGGGNGNSNDSSITGDMQMISPTAADKRNPLSKPGNDSTDLALNFQNSINIQQKPSNQRINRNTFGPNGSNKNSPTTPPSSNGCYLMDDDLDSVYSFASVASGRSSTMSGCDHPHVARNGTTFSGRKMKYVVHCSSYAGQTGDEYLTPTQRAQRHIRRLKELLAQARHDLEQKDSEILRLTKEVVELRLFKASLNSPEDRSNSSDAVTVREMKTSQDVSPITDLTDHGLLTLSLKTGTHSSHRHHHDGISSLNPLLEKMSHSEMQSSFSDSGHFEDMTTSSINSKDSDLMQTTCDKACTASGSDFYDQQRHDLIKMYEEKIEELIRCHDAETQQMKVVGTDRIEALLEKLADCNSRYADLVPDYEQAKDRIRELEKQLEDLQQKLAEQEDKQNKMYLHMYQKGQEAERISHADKILQFSKQPSADRVSVPELMQQLQVTQDELENIKDASYVQESGSSPILLSAKEAISLWLLGARKTMYRRLIDAQQTKNKVDPEITLQFLKSAVYYFLTDKENTQGHLNAIEAILGFSDSERHNIDKARAAK